MADEYERLRMLYDEGAFSDKAEIAVSEFLAAWQDGRVTVVKPKI